MHTINTSISENIEYFLNIFYFIVYFNKCHLSSCRFLTEQQKDSSRKPAHSQRTKRKSKQARIIAKQGRFWRKSYRGGPVVSSRALNDNMQGFSFKIRACKCGEFWRWMLELYFCVGYMHAFRQALPSHTKPQRLQQQEEGASFRADSVEPRIWMSSYLFRQRTKLGSYLYKNVFSSGLWMKGYLFIDTYHDEEWIRCLHSFVCFMFVNIRLFLCNKSGLNINYSGLNLPLWTNQDFFFFFNLFNTNSCQHSRVCINNG